MAPTLSIFFQFGCKQLSMYTVLVVHLEFTWVCQLFCEGCQRVLKAVDACLLPCRSRQSAITTELIEIISGAAALEG